MKIVLYTNILTPYRKFFYDLFYEECKKYGDDFFVLVMSETENNRPWHYKEFKMNYTTLLKGNTFSYGETYIHINYNLKDEIIKIKPDIVIASGSYLCPGTWKLAKLKEKLKYKLFFWSESHLEEKREYSELKIFIREKIRKCFYKKFDGFLCPGELAFKFVDKYSKGIIKKIWLPNLVDKSIFTKENYQVDLLCKNLHLNGKIILFLPVRLSEVKGIEPFMELLKLTKNLSNISLVIAGSGILEEKLKIRAKQLNIDAYFVGRKRQEEIASLYKNIDIFVLPSLSDPNPLSCIEALWSKKPLLISNYVGNYPEVIKQGKNGYMFSYKNKEETLNIIETMVLKNKEWRIKAGEESYDIAQKMYDPKKVVERVRKEIFE